jgi:hypothetical protein
MLYIIANHCQFGRCTQPAPVDNRGESRSPRAGVRALPRIAPRQSPGPLPQHPRLWQVPPALPQFPLPAAPFARGVVVDQRDPAPLCCSWRRTTATCFPSGNAPMHSPMRVVAYFEPLQTAVLNLTVIFEDHRGQKNLSFNTTPALSASYVGHTIHAHRRT